MVAMGSTCNSWIFSSIHAWSLPRNTLLAEAAKGRHGSREDNGSKGQQVTNSRIGVWTISVHVIMLEKRHGHMSILFNPHFPRRPVWPNFKSENIKANKLGKLTAQGTAKGFPQFLSFPGWERFGPMMASGNGHPSHQTCGYLNSYEVTWQVLGKCHAMLLPTWEMNRWLDG